MTWTRREFLRSSLIGTVGVGVAGFGLGCAAARSGPRRYVLPAVPAPPVESTVAVVPTAGSRSLREVLGQAIAAAGGLGFIKPGQSVLIKPALNSGNRYPATSDPETVLIVAQMVVEAGGRPVVADRTMFLRSTAAVLRRTGIYGAAHDAGAGCLALEDAAVVSLSHPLATHWPERTLHIYAPVAAADHVINLCTPRTHKLGDFTMALKNLVGVVEGARRLGMHRGAGLHERLAEISTAVRPSLVVMDGREGFGDGGPDSGDLVRPGFIAVGTDPVAIDAIGLAQLRLAGANDRLRNGSIWKLPQLRRAVEIGVGAGGPDRIRIVGGIDAAAEAALRRELA